MVLLVFFIDTPPFTAQLRRLRVRFEEIIDRALDDARHDRLFSLQPLKLGQQHEHPIDGG